MWIGIVVVLGFALNRIAPQASGSSIGAIIVIGMAQIRRLHDFGRSGWWAAGGFACWVVAMLLVGALTSVEIGVGVRALLNIALLVMIGVIPGEPNENRFGKPQKKLFATP